MPSNFTALSSILVHGGRNTHTQVDYKKSPEMKQEKIFEFQREIQEKRKRRLLTAH